MIFIRCPTEGISLSRVIADIWRHEPPFIARHAGPEVVRNNREKPRFSIMNADEIGFGVVWVMVLALSWVVWQPMVLSRPKEKAMNKAQWGKETPTRMQTGQLRARRGDERARRWDGVDVAVGSQTGRARYHRVRQPSSYRSYFRDRAPHIAPVLANGRGREVISATASGRAAHLEALAN